jgi:hypothetical protein
MSPIAEHSFTCSICGELHDGLPTDCGYELPDDVWAIPKEERTSRAKFTKDLCQMGDRWFIRCLLKIPFIERAGYYGWGIWVEVEKAVFDRYLELWEVDASSEAPYASTIANRLDAYNRSIGEPVLIQFGPSKDRPTAYFPAASDCDLAVEQSRGMSMARYHEIVGPRDAL